jgi:hypothetical protein
MGCNCGKRRMAQMTSANISAAGTEPADDSQVEAMVAGAQSAERHNARVRVGSSDQTSRR